MTSGGASSSTAPAAPAAAAGPPVGRPPRWDLQHVAVPTKASQAAAKATAVDPERLAVWLLELARREYAPTSAGPKRRKLELMVWLIGHGTDGVFPLTPFRIRVGAACLLSGHYRSVPGYLSEVKLEHIRLEHPWTDALALTLRGCSRACMRGLGPPQRAPEVRISLVARAEDPVFQPGVPGGPRRPRRAFVVAMWWLLREIELAALTLHVSSVKVWTMEGRRRATLFLPLTKKDQQGRGAARTWACICGAGRLADGGVDVREANLCPVCTLWDQVSLKVGYQSL